MTHLGTVIEIKGKIPEGRHGHGYFNLSGGSGLGGHLKIDDLGHICFLSLPFMGLESHSVQFFNAAGTVMFFRVCGPRKPSTHPGRARVVLRIA